MTENILKNNSAGGDMSAGNMNKSIHVHLSSNKTSRLRQKIELIKEDCLHDPNFKECIAQLQHFLNPVKPELQRDLQAKLSDADRIDELEDAEELKERFSKLLLRENLSMQAQEAYVHILTRIKLLYDGKVKPLLKKKAPLEDVEEKIVEVVEAIYEDLSGTVLEHDYRDIKGMLYFLTGNCHIEWSY
jgi:predicted transcriptional regulator